MSLACSSQQAPMSLSPLSGGRCTWIAHLDLRQSLKWKNRSTFKHTQFLFTASLSFSYLRLGTVESSLNSSVSLFFSFRSAFPSSPRHSASLISCVLMALPSFWFKSAHLWLSSLRLLLCRACSLRCPLYPVIRFKNTAHITLFSERTSPSWTLKGSEVAIIKPQFCHLPTIWPWMCCQYSETQFPHV